MIRALYIGGLESSQKGAVGTHTSGVISGLLSNGVDVCGVFLKGKEPEVAPGSIISVAPSKISGRLGSILNRLQIAVRVYRIKDSFDIVYHRYDPILSPLLFRYVTILEYNDDVLNQVDHVRKLGGYSLVGGALRKLLYPHLFAASERLCFKAAKRVVCVTRKLVEVVLKRQPQAVPMFLPNASLAVLDAVPGAIDAPPVLRLAHVGTLTYWDGILELLEAVAKFTKDRPDASIRLDIVGSGALLDQIRMSIQRHQLDDVVFLHAPMPHRDALTFLHNVDVVPLLKTSHAYGLSPIKFYEALCLGRFLICTNIPHISEVDGDAGIVVGYPIATDEIVRSLGEIFDNLSDIRREAPDRSRRAVRKHSWHARMNLLLREVVSSPQ